MGKHPERAFLRESLVRAATWALNCRRHSLRSAFELGAGRRRARPSRDRSERGVRAPSRKRRRAFVCASASRARAARLRPERDERGRGCSCTREVADRERGVGLGGVLGLGGGTRGPQRVAAMARVRTPRLRRRATPSRALPAAPRRRETASRGAHRPRKTRDPGSARRRVPTPNLRSRPLPALHSTARRLVALASGRRPVSDGGFTGVRALQRPPRAPTRAPPVGDF